MTTVKEQARDFWLLNQNATLHQALAEAQRRFATEAEHVEFTRAVIELQAGRRKFAEDAERGWSESRGY